MALTQMQIIQSLGEAMTWFQRELEWGVNPAELRHLCGRIGELYAALITSGQMALETNQKGYDVVGKDGERISVKTTTMGQTGHISFNSRTLELVDRVIILRINTDEMQVETLLDEAVNDARELMRGEPTGDCLVISLSKLNGRRSHKRPIATANEVSYRGVLIRELESGTIEAEEGGNPVSPVLPLLRRLASELNVSILNENGNSLNTRLLGTRIIKAVKRLQNGGMN